MWKGRIIAPLAKNLANRHERLYSVLTAVRTAVARGDYRQAWELIAPALKSAPNRQPSEEIGSLYLLAGRVRGWLGASAQISDEQETAKDLLVRAYETFAEIGLKDRTGEAAIDLGSCYWRLGELDNAAVYFKHGLQSQDRELQARARHGLGLCAENTGDYLSALEQLNLSASLADGSADHNVIFRIQQALGTVYRSLFNQTGNAQYSNSGLIAYAAAQAHCEAAGNERHLPAIHTGLGNLYLELKMTAEAAQQFAKSRAIAERTRDDMMIGYVDECRARLYLAEGRVDLAANLARNAVRIFSRGKQTKALCESLTTQGVALSRSGQQRQAREVFRRATALGREHGLIPQVCNAGLALCEELHGWLSLEEFNHAYLLVDEVIGDHEIVQQRRLRSCARLLVGDVLDHLARSSDSSTLDADLRQREQQLIQRALEQEKGSVTRAAKSLGLGHQTLINRINARHPELLSIRKPARVRRKSQIREMKSE
jgi:tetratricopeptide (TPR) repeat protein